MSEPRRGTAAFVAACGAALVVLLASVPAYAADAPVPAAGSEVVLLEQSVLPYGAGLGVVDALPPSAVLRVTAGGFEPESTGVIEQCTVRGCANRFPVSFDLEGRARFQYLVSDSFSPASTCRADAPPCVVRLSQEDAAGVRDHGVPRPRTRTSARHR